jgi:hypothetical protein
MYLLNFFGLVGRAAHPIMSANSAHVALRRAAICYCGGNYISIK